jgi:hypothetical protein
MGTYASPAQPQAQKKQADTQVMLPKLLVKYKIPENAPPLGI